MGSRHFVVEAKMYRGLHNPPSVVDSAIQQVTRYKRILESTYQDKNFACIIIMLCRIDNCIKQNVLEQHGILIWDIRNLIYLCKDNEELLNLLTKHTPYSIVEEKSERPIMLGKEDVLSKQLATASNDCVLEHFRYRLENCKSGRIDKRDQVYEKICIDILRFLFESEFSQISEQHRTGDSMFRMDLLCSLKGTTEFWKFLIHFYHTKFVVFEFKNYASPIPQNMVYITEKYLFPTALRNAAFVISRFGFSENAKKAALGCLTENKKLIISLNDEDLILMVSKKISGEEPSDHLLLKVEQQLMAVSK